nr:MAG TPA: hypothetical protein [Caudoviricetes sp.]
MDISIVRAQGSIVPAEGFLLNAVITNERTNRIIVLPLLSRRLVSLQTERCRKLLELRRNHYDKKTLCKAYDGQWLG